MKMKNIDEVPGPIRMNRDVKNTEHVRIVRFITQFIKDMGLLIFGFLLHKMQ